MRNALLLVGLAFLSVVGTAQEARTLALSQGRAESRNLALNRPSQQSSRSEWSSPTDPQGAVNGVKQGGFGFHTSLETNPWWQVDLGALFALQEVRVFNRMDCCSERARTLRVLLSADGQSWQTAYSHDGSLFGGANDGRPLKVHLQGQSARFVRLQLAERNYFHLDEVEVFGRPAEVVGLRNLALNRPAQQSSRSEWSSPTDPQGAVNGIKNGGFGFHTQGELNPWWQVDLGAVCNLQEVRVFNRQDCCAERARTLRVLLSHDGQTWQTAYVHDGSVFGGASDGRPLKVHLQGQRARFLRLQVMENTYLHLDEVEVYGHLGE